MIKIKKILLLLLLGLLLPKNLILHDYDAPSQQNQANHTLDTTIDGDILIVVGMLGGIDFYNISNPAVLNHLDNLQISGGGGGQGGGSKPNCLVTSGNYAYVTTSNGLGIINISNPSNPQYLGIVSGTNGYILENLDVHNNLLAIAAHEDGVLLYDISNPTSPNYISTIETENAWSVNLTDYYMYIADGVNLIVYYSFDDSNNYSLMSSIELSNAIKDIAVGDGYIFVAIGSDGVVAINTIVDATPQIIDIYNTSALANRIEIFDNNKVAVSDWDDVEVLELNLDNSSLDLVGYKNTTRRTMAIATKGNYIYSAEWKSVQIFEYGQVNGPDIDLNMYELNYPYVNDGESYTMTLEVTNNGNSTLDVTDAYTTNSEFSYDVLNDLNPGESQNINITYTANSINASGSYRIYSNDSDENEIICETNGNISGANVGDQAPDFNLPVMYNGSGNFQLSNNLGKVVVLAFFAPN
tara:strand:- start:33 stop:1439 length:1407 start_codon:yes stop_codon:yes gene_type:complete